MPWHARNTLRGLVLLGVLTSDVAWGQDNVPSLPDLSDRDIDVELSDRHARELPADDRAERIQRRETLLRELENERKDLKAKTTKYRDLAIETQAKRKMLKQGHAAALADVANELRVLLDTKLATIDFVTAQVAAQEAELALISAADERLAACRRHEEELQSLAVKLQELNAAGDKRISTAEAPRAKAALMRAQLRTLDEIAPVTNAEDFTDRLSRLEILEREQATAQIGILDGTLSTYVYEQAARSYYHELAACGLACGQTNDAFTDVRKAVQHSCSEMQVVKAMIDEGFGDRWSADAFSNAAGKGAYEIIILARNVSERAGKPIPELKRLMELLKFIE